MIRLMPHVYTLRENMFLDPGVESGVLSSVWWQAYFSCPRALDTTDKHSGAASVKYTRSDADTSGRQQGAIVMSQRPVASGGTYQVSAWVKGVAGQSYQISGRLVNTNNSVYSEGAKTTIVADGAWKVWSCAAFAITRPVLVALQIVTMTNAPLGTTIQIDDVRIERVS